VENPVKHSPQDSLIEVIPLLLCQIFSIFICYLMYLTVYSEATRITWSFIIGAIGILYINIVIFLYFERIKEASEIKRQNELADLQYQLKVDYFDQIKEEQAETRALWHDIKKYLNTMNELMSMNDISSARNCFAQVTDLFDGIGGFPFLWEQINGKGSARWASEIEEFPIAVTKCHLSL
jgi:ABC-type bacteriocin/lantibiotic exporter with double-glycine peptidase domain